jgi:hypothetical protein
VAIPYLTDNEEDFQARTLITKEKNFDHWDPTKTQFITKGEETNEWPFKHQF